MALFGQIARGEATERQNKAFAHACHAIVFAAQTAQVRGDGLAQALWEPVDFAHQNCQCAMTAAAPRQLGVQPLEQGAPVGQARQGIHRGQPVGTLLFERMLHR